ncbi:GPO family capsid scaffolding protein [Limnobaculum xujianqingii]|uniref:GPO family capsid scaffolding protein n=1 Tax=Limnobaculum xujianqingii TaxID=2738837 RepID=UPI0015B86300|nr:GPO family capsid scaffolding protein [Limnobaculum xujianqingii]
MGKKSKFFRVAVEGALCDGRTLERKHIEQMAANYDPKVYLARANLEHLRSVYPDSVFRSYGEVLAAKTEEVSDGALAGKLALLVQVDASDDLVALNQSKQKLSTSIEYYAEFADTGEAYLVGLAFTDNPASLGTEMMMFCANAQSNPLASRKTNLLTSFTEAQETTLDFEIEPEPKPSLLSMVKGMLGKNSKQQADIQSDVSGAVELLTSHQQTLADRISAMEKLQADDSQKSQLEQLSKDFTDLRTQLSIEDRNSSHRPPATGGGSSIVTDC